MWYGWMQCMRWDPRGPGAGCGAVGKAMCKCGAGRHKARGGHNGNKVWCRSKAGCGQAPATSEGGMSHTDSDGDGDDDNEDGNEEHAIRHNPHQRASRTHSLNFSR